MSFDLFVFEPTSAPRIPKQFLAWYEKQTNFDESVSYYDPANCTDNLRKWLFQMLAEFPAMNGPHRAADAWEADEDLDWTDYTIGTNFIYATFPWNAAEQAKLASHKAALANRLGVFDASEEPAKISFPDGAEFHISSRPWWRFW